jgi:hypothetical protein
LQFTDRFVFDAIRSRCPTSAGMANILANVFNGAGQHQRRQLADGGQGNEWVQYAFWNMVHESFTIARPSVAWVNEYVKNHLIDIATDNLKGQCTSGTYCFVSSRCSADPNASLSHQKPFPVCHRPFLQGIG